MKMLNRFYLMLIALVVFVSCDNDDDYFRYNNNQIAAHGIIVNASANSGDLFFFADENQVNSSGINYTDAFGYFNFFIGDRVLSLQDSNGTELATTEVTLADNDIFSAFAVNEFSNIELVVYNDELIRPGSGRTSVRFINLTPDANGITVNNASEALTENLEFKSTTEFMELNSGTYTFEFADSETGTVLFTSSELTLSSNRIYTIYTKGFVNPEMGSNDTFAIERIRNL